ncbi:MAG: helix-turn-helix domain-containing protein [archaeon]
MFERLLGEVGLTKSEIAVYFALLDLGQATTGEIIAKAKISSGKIYEVLGRLTQKGLAAYIVKSGVKHFEATAPERLMDFVNEKQNLFEKQRIELEKAIPEISAMRHLKAPEQKAEVYEGKNGFKSFYDWVLEELEKGDTIYITGVAREANERFGAYLLNWNRRRIAKGIKMKIIYAFDSKEFGKMREKMKLTEVRYMPKGLMTPAWFDVFKDYAVTIAPSEDPAIFLIKNKKVAGSYMQYFELLWKQSRL